MRRFSNQWPPKALYSNDSHTDGGVINHAGRKPARQEQSGGGCVSLRHTSTLHTHRWEGPGIEPATLPVTSNQPAVPHEPHAAPTGGSLVTRCQLRVCLVGGWVWSSPWIYQTYLLRAAGGNGAGQGPLGFQSTAWTGEHDFLAGLRKRRSG